MRESIIPFVLTTLVLSGCTTPLKRELKKLAPAFTARQPATSDHYMGHQFTQKDFTNEACYGSTEVRKSAGPDSFEMSYVGDDSAKFKVDFGEPIVIGAGATALTVTSVTLKGIELQELRGIFFNPSSLCVEAESESDPYAAPKGKVEKIVNRSLRAKELSVSGLTTNGVRAEVTAQNQGGILISTGTHGYGWGGKDLFFAYQLRKVRTIHHPTVRYKQLPIGTLSQRLPRQACRVRVNKHVEPGWEGELVCLTDTGETSFPIIAKSGSAFVHTAGNVSYQVEVDYEGQQLVDVAVSKWTVDDR